MTGQKPDETRCSVSDRCPSRRRLAVARLPSTAHRLHGSPSVNRSSHSSEPDRPDSQRRNNRPTSAKTANKRNISPGYDRTNAGQKPTFRFRQMPVSSPPRRCFVFRQQPTGSTDHRPSTVRPILPNPTCPTFPSTTPSVVRQFPPAAAIRARYQIPIQELSSPSASGFAIATNPWTRSVPAGSLHFHRQMYKFVAESTNFPSIFRCQARLQIEEWKLLRFNLLCRSG